MDIRFHALTPTSRFTNTDIDVPLGFLSTEMTDLGFYGDPTFEPSSALLLSALPPVNLAVELQFPRRHRADSLRCHTALDKNSFGDALGVQLKVESHLASYTAIHWTWNPAIGWLTPHWVTKSGSTIPVFIVLIDATPPVFQLTGDSGALNVNFNNAGTNVTFGIVVSGI
ncbi:hypothetical protein B0H14DRAFT_3473839 [Mycena olivaceomarginata]|nr:hypothetical protein B0H14DRAFT_3473839 [Mycena olivaceomarginata]